MYIYTHMVNSAILPHMNRFEEVSIPLSRLECAHARHYWVVVVGVRGDEFPSLNSFLRNRCGEGIRMEEKLRDEGDGHYLWPSSRYQITIHDILEDNILSFDDRKNS